MTTVDVHVHGSDDGRRCQNVYMYSVYCSVLPSIDIIIVHGHQIWCIIPFDLEVGGALM